jgi:Tol biopolymer transport system component
MRVVARLTTLTFAFLAAGSAAAQPVRIDVAPDGLPADGPSLYPVVSFDGRYVAFVSAATNLVPGPTANTWNLYRYDRVTHEVLRPTLRPRRFEAIPRLSGISHDGRVVLFSSAEPDWVDGDTNDTTDVFQVDVTTGETWRVSVGAGGLEANGPSTGESMSTDGILVAFVSWATNLGSARRFAGNVFVRDTRADRTVQVSIAAGGVATDGFSTNPSISPDGEWVVFSSTASNLVGAPPRRSTNHFELYLSRWHLGSILQVGTPRGTDGVGATLTWNARQVLFASALADIVPGARAGVPDLYLWDRLNGGIGSATLTATPQGASESPIISLYGRYVTRVQAGPRGESLLAHHDRHTRTITIVASGAEPSRAPMSLDGRWVAFAVTGAAYLRDMGVPAEGLLPGGDEDGDGIGNGWEERTGLDPLSALGDDGASGDPDHDGRTNGQEFDADTHPRGFFTRTLAEGASNAFFRTRLALLSTTSTPAHAWLRFEFAGGSHMPPLLLDIPANGHRAVDSAWLPSPGRPFATVIESDVPLAVARTMTWDEGEYGAHAETASQAPSTTWFLAEGSTAGPFALFYLLHNPQRVSVAATVQFVRPAGQAPLTRTYTLPPSSRTTIEVEAVDALLTSTDVSAAISAAQPIVVERAMYLSRPDQPFAAGLGSAGVTAPATRWLLAEGATGPFFDTFILLLNPADDVAQCEVRYATTAGEVFVKPYALPAHSRTTIWMDQEDIPGGGRALANVAAATTITSTNGVPIVAERTMWWPDGDWYEAHGSAGAVAAASRWAVAGLELGPPPRGADAYLLVLNTSPDTGTVLVTLHPEDGQPIAKAFRVGPFARVTVSVRDVFPAAQSFTLPFGAVVEAVGTSPIPIVVEQAVYWNAGGVVWAAGTNALGTPLP